MTTSGQDTQGVSAVRRTAPFKGPPKAAPADPYLTYFMKWVKQGNLSYDRPTPNLPTHTRTRLYACIMIS